jgi:hypothetical protein
MSERPITKSAAAETPKPSSAHQESSAKKSVPVSPSSGVSRWLPLAALITALIAVVLAALAYFLPAHNSASVPQQGGDAKGNVCAAYEASHKAVVINTHMQSRNPNDAVADLSVATNARLSLIGGGAYLRERLAANTAAPSDLANAAYSFANTIEQLGVNYLIQAGPEVQDPVRKDLDNQIAQLNKLCGH